MQVDDGESVMQRIVNACRQPIETMRLPANTKAKSSKMNGTHRHLNGNQLTCLDVDWS